MTGGPPDRLNHARGTSAPALLRNSRYRGRGWRCRAPPDRACDLPCGSPSTEARRSSVTVRIRMDITKHPVPKYGPHQRLVRFSSRIRHHRHGVHVNDVVSMQVVTAAIENILIYINTLTT